MMRVDGAFSYIVVMLSELYNDMAQFFQDDKHIELIFSFLLVIFTAFLARYTNQIKNITKNQLDHNHATERAYVKMSHFPPGLTIEKTSGMFWATIQIKNCGRTPAKITDIVLRPKLLPNNERLPKDPDYHRSRVNMAPLVFLVSDDDYCHTETFTVGVDDIPAIESGIKMLYFYGYADYIDVFGERHRTGYARLYDPQQDDETGLNADQFARRNNLILSNKVRYNYDRVRNPGEGNDWSEQ